MYYDDQARRFNFVSGLALGAVLGVGLALLAAPQPQSAGALKVLRREVRGRRRRAGGGWKQLRKGMADSLADVLEAGRAQVRARTK